MLNNQSRKNLVETYKIFGDAKKTAQAFGVTKWTVYRLNKQLQVTGSVELKTSTRGRKSQLTEKDLNQISALIIENPTITLQEIKDELKKLRPLTLEDKYYNRIVSKLRICIEHIIRDVKRFRIFSERYRCRHKTFKKRFNLVCAIYNFGL